MHLPTFVQDQHMHRSLMTVNPEVATTVDESRPKALIHSGL